MKQLRKLLNANISKRTLLVLFLGTNAIFLYMLTISIPHTMRFANGLKLLDMMPMGYDLSYVTGLFNALGTAGRDSYLTTQLPIDMVYPLLFGITYSFLLAYYLKRLNKHNSQYQLLCLLPILAGIADYLENIGIILLLQNSSNVTATAVKVTSFFSVVKSVSTTVYFIVLIIVLGIVARISMINKKSTFLSR